MKVPLLNAAIRAFTREPADYVAKHAKNQYKHNAIRNIGAAHQAMTMVHQSKQAYTEKNDTLTNPNLQNRRDP
jgi:hypothetical protein